MRRLCDNAPIVTAQELNNQVIEFDLEMVGAQGIEPWTSPV
jgi:hypothetical protein